MAGPPTYREVKEEELPCNAFILGYIAAPSVPESALPLGMKQEDGNTQLIPMELSEQFPLIIAIENNIWWLPNALQDDYYDQLVCMVVRVITILLFFFVVSCVSILSLRR